MLDICDQRNDEQADRVRIRVHVYDITTHLANHKQRLACYGKEKKMLFISQISQERADYQINIQKHVFKGHPDTASSIYL